MLSQLKKKKKKKKTVSDLMSVILSVFAPKTIVLNRHNGTITTPVLNETLNKSPQTDHNQKMSKLLDLNSLNATQVTRFWRPKLFYHDI